MQSGLSAPSGYVKDRRCVEHLPDESAAFRSQGGRNKFPHAQLFTKWEIHTHPELPNLARDQDVNHDGQAVVDAANGYKGGVAGDSILADRVEQSVVISLNYASRGNKGVGGKRNLMSKVTSGLCPR